MTRPTSSRLRFAIAAIVLGGLAVFEVHDGLGRIEEARDRGRRERIDIVDRRQDVLLAEVSEQLGNGRRHATHLRRHPLVVELLEAPEGTADEARELGRILQPYLVSFAEIDRLSILDAEGRERFRCERMGGGVATLPLALLDPEPRRELADLAFAPHAAPVAVSPLSYDAERVEVAELDRRVFHLAAVVGTKEAPRGAVVVTVYATPLLRTLKSFEPLRGAFACLLDEQGAIFAPGDEDSSREAFARLLSDAGGAREAVLSGERLVETSQALLLARSTGVQPAAYLVTAVPWSSLTPDLSASDSLRAALPSLLLLGGMALGAWLWVRAGQRAARVAEIERYAARIRDESEKHRALMEAAADMILIVDPDSERVEDANPRARELLGSRAGNEATVAVLLEGFANGGGERLLDGVRRAALPASEPVVVGGLVLASDGRRRELEARCVGIEYGGRRLVEVLFDDRTRELIAERRARTAERLSALGLLTAGVAHEINNPLEGIANYLTLARRTDDAEQRARHLEQVSRGFERIRELTGDLLSHARPSAESGAAKLEDAVQGAVSMARYSKELRDTEVELQGFDEGFVVAGSAGGLEQVCLNLFLNAGRAMEGAGRIVCRARGLDDDVVELVVEDEGPGIAPEDLDRVFDPFFTRNGGTGLGLSVSYQIVLAHGGDMTVSNGPTGGARFVMTFPLFPTDSNEAEGDS